VKTSISAVADTWRDTMTGEGAYDGTPRMFVEQPRSAELRR
jgi:hypothetical protein